MVLSKLCLLLFGLILCAVLIAVLTQKYNDTLCARVSDLVKIKHGGFPKSKSNIGKQLVEHIPRRYRGGHSEFIEPDGNSLSVNGYNREYEEPKSSFRNITVEQMATTLFPPERTF
jgi:hypothetical protein